MNIMNKNYINKILPGMVSVFIILGMAMASFATNVDLEAFVNRDDYLTKYYEIDWRIDDVEKNLERMYKFTCTNLKSFGGVGTDVAGDTINYRRNTTQSYNWYMNPVADLSQEGYLRFNPADAINAYGNHSRVDTYVREIPASLLRWRNDVELYPNTKLKIIVKRSWPNTTAASQTVPCEQTLIMGPFKKFPHITNNNDHAGDFCSSNGYFLSIAGWSMSALSYNYGTDTEPTTWTSFTGSLYTQTMDRNIQSYPNLARELLGGILTEEEMEQGSYSAARQDLAATYTYIYPNTLWGTNLSGYDKLWIKAVSTGGTDASHLANDFTITNWNYNK